MASGNDLSIRRVSPVVDYTSMDFDALKADLIAYAQAKYPDRWTDFNDTQWAVVFLEMQCYIGDLLTYNLNSMLREAFTGAAVRKANVEAFARTIGMELTYPVSSTTTLRVSLNPLGAYPFTLTKVDNKFSNGSTEDEVIFQPISDTVVAAYPGVGYVDVSAIEGERFDAYLVGVGTGAANQKWQFPQDSIVFDSVSITVGGVGWTRVLNLVMQASTAQVYRLIRDDEGFLFILFGDGIHGAKPGSGVEIRGTFRQGGGKRGNLNKTAITTVVSAHSNVTGVTNSQVEATGGDNEQTLASAKQAIPGFLSTNDRAVSLPDYEAMANKVSGVKKSRASLDVIPGSNVVRLIVAPTGGGSPSSTLKKNVSSAFIGKKGHAARVKVFGPTYKDLRLQLLAHINPAVRATDGELTLKNGLLNSAGTGLLDFDNLDFEAVVSTGEAEEYLLAQTRFQNYFATLKTKGIDRVEIERMDIDPVARIRDEGNTGDGTVGSIILNDLQRRREYYILLVSSAQYHVYERIVGRVSYLSDTELTDTGKQFDSEGVVSFAGYKLAPYRTASSLVDVASASDTDIVLATGSPSLFAMTQPQAEYYTYSPTPTVVTVGSQYTSPDGSVKFTLAAGATPFLAGDSLYLDVYPKESDIRLRPDEYPRLTSANLTIRTSGGLRL